MPHPSSPLPPRFASAISTDADTERAIEEVCSAAMQQLAAAGDSISAAGAGVVPDLAMVFVSHHHGPDVGPIAHGISARIGSEALLGCTGEAIVGGRFEMEGRPALSLWLARMPGARVRPMHLTFEKTSEGAAVTGWPDDLTDEWPEGAALLLLAEPFSFPADVLLDRINEERPGVVVMGGMASGAYAPGENRLLFGREERTTGAVAAMISGNIRMRPVVSQGCRPIGRHYVITKAERNVILELGGRPPLELLQELFATLSPEEQQRLRGGLHVGRVIDEYRAEFRRGDFLVRNVIGADQATGAISIGDYVRPGQTVQFHLRDARSADDDLRELLAAAKIAGAPRGGLLFSCNGRGTRLFDAPHHDAGAVGELLDDIPLAGFFAAGEFGPIAAKNFVHGFTASLALFEAT